MRKKLFAVCTALCLALCLTVPALAAQDYGLVYDATDLLDAQAMSSLSNDTLYNLTEQHKVQVRVDVVDNLEDEAIEDYAQIFYDSYGYGYNDSGDGVLLMLYVIPNDAGDLDFGGYTVLPGGTATASIGEQGLDTLRTALDSLLNEQNFSGGIESDEAICESAINTYAMVVDTLLGGGGIPADTETTGAETEKAPVETTQSVLANVTDSAGLLNEEELAQLETAAQSLSAQYQCGVYIVTVDDFTDYNEESVYECAKGIYKYYDLGYGEGRDGVMLLLSMADRDYSLIAYGDFGNAAFTDYGKGVLEDEFLDNFGNDDWYGGFSDYLSMTDTMLEAARNGQPVDVGSSIGSDKSLTKSLPMGGAVGCVISLLTCLGFKSKMKSVKKALAAEEYVPDNGLILRAREDIFTHTTHTVEHIEKKGGTSVGSDGFSGSSGKF